MAGGRPTLYTQELADLICERVATHREGLKKICAKFDDMPDETTITLWRIKHHEFSLKYAEAKRIQVDKIVDELDDIMDENLGHYTDPEGNKRIDSPSATIAIAKANNKKWLASKLAPKLYGDNSKEDDKSSGNTLIEKLLEKL